MTRGAPASALRKHRARERAKEAAEKWHEARRAKQGRAGVLKDQPRDALGRVVPSMPRLTGHNAAVLMAMAQDEWLPVSEIQRRSGRPRTATGSSPERSSSAP